MADFDIEEAIKPYADMAMPVRGQEVTIFPTHVEVKMENGSVKCISTADFAAVLAGTVQSEVESNALLLPANCYYWASGLTELKISCYYPGKIRQISHIARDGASRDVHKYDVPFPNIIISHKLKRMSDKWEWKDSRYLATSKTIAQLPLTFLWVPDHENQIWPIPFSNMYAEGNLCYGQNSVPRSFKENFRGLDWHFALLYSTPFNDDLGVHGTATVHRSISGWYDQLSGHKVFPYELMKHGKKVDPAIKSVSANIFDVQLEQ